MTGPIRSIRSNANSVPAFRANSLHPSESTHHPTPSAHTVPTPAFILALEHVLASGPLHLLSLSLEQTLPLSLQGWLILNVQVIIHMQFAQRGLL